MKTYILTLILLACGFFSMAQDPGNSNSSKENLQLSDAQKDSLRRINDDYAARRRALKNDETMERAANRAERKALKEEKREAVEEVLTAEQEQKLKQHKAEKREQRIDAHREELESELQLTPEQSLRMEAAIEKYRTGLKALPSDTDANDKRKKDLRETFRSEVKSILTPEQFQKWGDLKKSRKYKRPGKPGKKRHPEK